MLSKTQLGWLKLEKRKREEFEALNRQELEVQGKLLDITDDKDLPSVQTKIKEAKSISATAKDQRLAFTNFITTSLIDPAMLYEKRSAELIKGAEGHEFLLRKAEAEKAAQAGAYNRELASLKAHITNEHYRIAVGYRAILNEIVVNAYKTALRGKTPVADIPAYKERIVDMLVAAVAPASVKFARTLVSDADALKEFNLIPKYGKEQKENDLGKAIADLNDRFALYAEELQMADAAIKATEEAEAAKAAEQASKLELEQATNVLIAQAEVGTVETVKIKKSMAPVVENTQAWAMAVMSNFIKNFAEAAPKLKIKTWEKLSIAQMADALAKLVNETGATFQGITFKEVEK